mmetsp:Transcript_377/g.289  ORF Transcript_377/g.289 Transcript_377/m.289 type:complete len:100 (-) Transcript_377:5-304(-)
MSSDDHLRQVIETLTSLQLQITSMGTVMPLRSEAVRSHFGSSRHRTVLRASADFAFQESFPLPRRCPAMTISGKSSRPSPASSCRSPAWALSCRYVAYR